MRKGDLERGMLKQWPMLDITRSNEYLVRTQVNTVKSHFIQSARDNIARLYDLHHFESAAESSNSLIPFWQTISIFFL
jgi:hypothetical protein